MSEIKKRTKGKSSALGNFGEYVTKVDKKITQNDGEQIAGDKQSQNRHIPLRVFSRIVVITSLLIVVYFTSKDDKIKTIAKQSEVLSGKGQTVECSADYIKELTKYEDCVPRDCGRYITDKVISVKEADSLLEIAKKGLKLGGSSGGASILDLHSGALSMGQHFINIYKKGGAESLFTEKDFKTYKIIKDKIKFAICHHFDVEPNKMYLTHPTFFSEITAKKAVTLHDEYWHPHVDKETYKSFHFTSLLYLSDYNIDFEGGRFVFIDEKQNGTVEPRKGRVSMFTSGAENTHYVEKVTNGIRYAMTISFTCDKQYSIEVPSLDKYAH